jgi:hypothetical protein
MPVYFRNENHERSRVSRSHTNNHRIFRDCTVSYDLSNRAILHCVDTRPVTQSEGCVVILFWWNCENKER